MKVTVVATAFRTVERRSSRVMGTVIRTAEPIRN